MQSCFPFNNLKSFQKIMRTKSGPWLHYEKNLLSLRRKYSTKLPQMSASAFGIGKIIPILHTFSPKLEADRILPNSLSTALL